MAEAEREPTRLVVGDGPVGRLIGAHDWEKSAVGPPATWPATLRIAVQAALASPLPMFVVWGPSRTVIYNEAFVPILGDRHPDAMGRPYLEVWPEVAAQEDPVIEQVFRGQSVHFDNRETLYRRHAVAEPAWFTSAFSPLRDEFGEIAGGLCITEETTERVLAGRNTAFLHRLEARLRALLDPREIIAAAQEALGSELGASRVGYGDVDEHGRLTTPGSWTDGSVPPGQGEHDLTAFGSSVFRSLRRGETLVVHDPDEDVRTKGPRMRPAFAHLGIGATVTVSLIKQGRMRAALYVHQKSPRRWTAYEVDLVEGVAERTWAAVERARAEAAAREKDALFATFAEAVPNHIWSATPNGRPDWFNAQSYAYTGVALGELSGDSWRDAVHPDDLEGAFDAWRQAISTGEIYETSFRVRRHDGAYRWHLIRALPIRAADGSIERWIGANTDIENEKQTAAALAELAATLEERVGERTREVEEAQEQLRHSQKMEAVGQLTGGIAHDFNNLLQGIVGSLDLVQKRVEQGRSHEIGRFVSGAITSANRAAALTHRLLAFSRRQPLDPKLVKVNPLIASMEDLLRRSMGEKVIVDMALSGALWTTRCDPNQLESALLNLCINGRDAMPDGGRLSIETGNQKVGTGSGLRELVPGDYVYVRVQDTGAGMPPEVLERAFEPFFTTKPIGQGTGLGLSMVYGFARQSEGHVKIVSAPGEGTSVWLYLPRAKGQVDDAEAEVWAGASPRADEGETVVVVEDEPVVRNLVVEVLSDLGYRPLEAPDGPSGLKVLQSEGRIDLLVTDIGLPGLNGRQLAEAARELRPDLKVLFMTGYAENAAQASGFLEKGMQLITKPFAMDALAERVREMMKGP